MSERHMPSIFPECDQFKQIYDKCFTEFFQKFIAPNFRHQYAVNPCERLHEVYKECVQEGLKKKRPFDIDLDEVRKEILNTEADRLKAVQEEKERQSNRMDPEAAAQQKSSASSSRKETTEDRFDKLERTLEQFQENARIMGSMAADFNARSQDQFNQKIHTLISGLAQMDAMKNEFNDVKVPLELMDVLDRGETPYKHSKEMLEKTLHKNEEVNGKIEMYSKFRSSLLKHMGTEMPDETLKYLSARHELNETLAQELKNAAAAMKE